MPTRTRNSISKAMQKISSTPNSKHHQKRISTKRKARKRNIHRTADTCTTFTDTLYSVKLLPKSVIEIKVLQGSDALFKTEQQVIQCCKDLYTSCATEIGQVAFSSNRPILVLSEINERLMAQFPEYNCYEEYDDELKKWQFAVCVYYNFDYLYFLSFDLLMECAGDNKQMQQLVFVACKIIQSFGIDVCFNSQEEEIHVEMLDEWIYNEEQELQGCQDKDEKKSLAENIDDLQNRKAFFTAGEFYEAKLKFQKAKDTWNLSKVKPVSSSQEELLMWFKEVDKIKKSMFKIQNDLGNYVDDNVGMDGALEASRAIRVCYSEDGIASNITAELNDFANNEGIEQLVWKNILSPTVKTPTIPQQFYDILNIMSFPNTKYTQ